jgi:hypothetical protein
MIKVLSIGNSFSTDAQRYLSGIGKNRGIEIKNVNLYIGGCMLCTHYEHMLADDKAYLFEYKGESTGVYVSIREALESDTWDYITLQQCSRVSFDYETFEPYIIELAEYCRSHAPGAKLLIHQTWSFDTGSARLLNAGFRTHDEMQDSVTACYRHAAQLIGADIIPCGEVMRRMLHLGIDCVTRDTFHANFGFGRYALALTWFGKLTGEDVSEDNFDDFDVEVSEEERRIAITAVRDVLKNA